MNLITITDEMLESAPIEESDKAILKKARWYLSDNTKISLESPLSQSYIRRLSSRSLNYLFEAIRVQSFNSGKSITLAGSISKLNEKLDTISSLKDENYVLVIPGEFLNGFKAAIKELNEVYLGSLESE
jgi:hypothetical protein